MHLSIMEVFYVFSPNITLKKKKPKIYEVNTSIFSLNIICPVAII